MRPNRSCYWRSSFWPAWTIAAGRRRNTSLVYYPGIPANPARNATLPELRPIYQRA